MNEWQSNEPESVVPVQETPTPEATIAPTNVEATPAPVETVVEVTQPSGEVIEPKEEKPKKKSKLPIILIVLVLLIGLGVGGFFVYKHFHKEEPKEEVKAEEPKVEEPKEEEAPAEEVPTEEVKEVYTIPSFKETKEYYEKTYNIKFEPYGVAAVQGKIDEDASITLGFQGDKLSHAAVDDNKERQDVQTKYLELFLKNKKALEKYNVAYSWLSRFSRVGYNTKDIAVSFAKDRTFIAWDEDPEFQFFNNVVLKDVGNFSLIATKEKVTFDIKYISNSNLNDSDAEFALEGENGNPTATVTYYDGVGENTITYNFTIADLSNLKIEKDTYNKNLKKVYEQIINKNDERDGKDVCYTYVGGVGPTLDCYSYRLVDDNAKGYTVKYLTLQALYQFGTEDERKATMNANLDHFKKLASNIKRG